MEIKSFHHCDVRVDNLEEAVVFYRDILGLSVREDETNDPVRKGISVWFDLGAGQLHVTVGPRPQPNGQHFAIEVNDIEATARELEAAGVTVSKRVTRGGEGIGRRTFMKVSDPSGNLIEVLAEAS